MAYTKFKTEIETANYFNLDLKTTHLFQDIQPVEPTLVLKELLNFGQFYAFASEKAKNEYLVMPFLMELIKHHLPEYSPISGAELNIESNKDLKGVVDFIICGKSKIYWIEKPLVPILQAKKGDIELTIGKAMAQMVAIRLHNQKDEIELRPSYGCVTNGVNWKFLCLDGSVFYIDLDDYYINSLSQLLGVWKHILTIEN